MELRIASQVEEMGTLATEILQLNETLKAVRKKHQGEKYGSISSYYSYIKKFGNRFVLCKNMSCQMRVHFRFGNCALSPMYVLKN